MELRISNVFVGAQTAGVRIIALGYFACYALSYVRASFQLCISSRRAPTIAVADTLSGTTYFTGSTNSIASWLPAVCHRPSSGIRRLVASTCFRIVVASRYRGEAHVA